MYKGYYSSGKYSAASYNNLASGETAYPSVSPARLEQDALDVIAHTFMREVGTDAAEAASAEFQIAATAHAAQRGDVIRMTSGAYSGREVKVITTTANVIFISDKINVGNTSTFQILRHKAALVAADGTLNTTSTQAPIMFDRDSVDTEVKEDTGTPSNSRPLPVKIFGTTGSPIDAATAAKQDTIIGHVDGIEALLSTIDGRVDGLEALLTSVDGKLPATLGQKAMAASLAVVIASDQSSLPVTPGVPAAVTVKSAAITVGTSAIRLTTDAAAPSATRRILMANTDPSVGAKFWIGPAAVTASTGIQLNGGETFDRPNDAGDYYIISDTAGQTVLVMEQE